MSIIEKFDGKKVLLWGYGAEGKSSQDFLSRCCAPELVSVYEGTREELPLSDYDIIIKSPGVPGNYRSEPKITSQTQLFLEEFGDRTIGITGTKGKSTTTAMLYEVLKDGLKSGACLLGNIGIPCLDAYEDMASSDKIAVFEMSCHQLFNNTVSPHIAVFLNLFEDHLDYYGNRENYFFAKSNISLHQKEGDYLFAGTTVPFIKTLATRVDVQDVNEYKYDMKVLGIHNQFNAEVIYRIATDIFGIEPSKVLNSIRNFNALPHRLQYFVTLDGVRYYDDSISTIPEASISAIESVQDAKTLIIGGMDRGIDYGVLIEAIKAYSDINFVCCYESGERIYKEVSGCQNAYLVKDLGEAVKMAKEITTAGSCILSPAAASYGYFKNFMDRGDSFQRLVKS